MIRWSPLAVNTSMDDVSELLDQAAPFIERAKGRVKEAESIPNLPEYMKQHLVYLKLALGRLEDMRKAVQRVRTQFPKTNWPKTGPLDWSSGPS